MEFHTWESMPWEACLDRSGMRLLQFRILSFRTSQRLQYLMYHQLHRLQHQLHLLLMVSSQVIDLGSMHHTDLEHILDESCRISTILFEFHLIESRPGSADDVTALTEIFSDRHWLGLLCANRVSRETLGLGSNPSHYCRAKPSKLLFDRLQHFQS